MTADVARADAEASAFMQRGLALLTEARVEAPLEALACFDRALAIRQALPLEQDPGLPSGLAACWLNRAEVLMRLGSEAHLTQALSSIEEAIRLLTPLPVDADARVARGLAVAHQHRGLVLKATGRANDAIDAFEAAVAILQRDALRELADRPTLLGASLVNLANAHAAHLPSSLALVRSTAERAAGLVAAVEHDDPAAAEVGLTARYLLCHTYAEDLQTQHATGRVAFDAIHRATDAVDEGVEIVQHWERAGVGRFREIAAGLFRFGALVYGTYQPQFLDEFIDGTLDASASSPAFIASAEMQGAASEIRATRPPPDA
jgi:tetratricopeptide (TPR) repeat protein